MHSYILAHTHNLPQRCRGSRFVDAVCPRHCAINSQCNDFRARTGPAQQSIGIGRFAGCTAFQENPHFRGGGSPAIASEVVFAQARASATACRNRCICKVLRVHGFQENLHFPGGEAPAIASEVVFAQASAAATACRNRCVCKAPGPPGAAGSARLRTRVSAPANQGQRACEPDPIEAIKPWGPQPRRQQEPRRPRGSIFFEAKKAMVLCKNNSPLCARKTRFSKTPALLLGKGVFNF